MLLPALICILPFVFAVILTVRFSFSAESQTISGWGLDGYRELLDPYFYKTFFTTFKLALISTIICLILAAPIALLMVSIQRSWLRRVVTCLILLPMIVNLLIQSYGWIIVLSNNGVINSTLQSLNLIDKPIRLLFNETGVLIGLVQTALPLTIFPILVSMRAVNLSYIEAAMSLGASPFRVFWSIILPLLKPGLLSAGSIAFAFNASAFAVPLLLGGRKVSMVGTAVRDTIFPLLDWSAAAAAGTVLIVITITIIAIAAWLANRTSHQPVNG